MRFRLWLQLTHSVCVCSCWVNASLSGSTCELWDVRTFPPPVSAAVGHRSNNTEYVFMSKALLIYMNRSSFYELFRYNQCHTAANCRHLSTIFIEIILQVERSTYAAAAVFLLCLYFHLCWAQSRWSTIKWVPYSLVQTHCHTFLDV